MMLAFLVPYCLGGIAGPALQSTITAQVDVREQGELQGALTSLMSATSIVGPPVMTNLFYFGVKNNYGLYLPGAPFFLGAILMAISAIIAYVAFHKGRNRLKPSSTVDAAEAPPVH